MAQRFGGKYSPDQTPGEKKSDPQTNHPQRNAFDGKQRSRAGGRVNFLFILPLLFLIPAFTGPASGLFLGLGACGLMLLAAWLTRDGIHAQEAYEARKVARRPAIPRKIFGSVLTGLGIAVGVSMWQPGLIYPILFAVAGAVLHFGAFGPDPLSDKGAEGVDQFQSDRVARAVDEAEAYLKAMKDAILRAKDRSLEARVDAFATTARQMFRTIEGDPRDLTSARKYLSVYLMGARDASVKFVDFYAQNRDPQARTDYEALLTDLETNFASRTQKLLSDNHTDLDVEIQVLRDRLKLEG